MSAFPEQSWTLDIQHLPPLVQIEPAQPRICPGLVSGAAGRLTRLLALHFDPDQAAADRVPTPFLDADFRLDPHLCQGGQIDALQIVVGRAPGHVCAAPERHFGGPLGQGQGQQHGLQDEAHRPGAAALGRLSDIKDIVARLRCRLRNKGQRIGIEFGPFDSSIAHLGSGANAGQVLGPQPWFSPSGADPLDANRLPCDG